MEGCQTGCEKRTEQEGSSPGFHGRLHGIVVRFEPVCTKLLGRCGLVSPLSFNLRVPDLKTDQRKAQWEQRFMAGSGLAGRFFSNRTANTAKCAIRQPDGGPARR
jgi:hypothetical protein